MTMKVQLTRTNLIEHNMGAELLRRLITHPDSTFMIALDDGQTDWMLLLVDREAVPREGSMMLLNTDRGFKLTRCREPNAIPRGLWGVVIWQVKRP